MEMLIQPNAWSCMPAAFGMLLNVPIPSIISEVGHDGSEVLFPDRPSPLDRRGFCLEEMIDVCLMLDVYPVTITPQPSYLGVDLFSPDKVEERMIKYLQMKNAVLLGEVQGRIHAAAWNREKVFDPVGQQYSVSEFNIHQVVFAF